MIMFLFGISVALNLFTVLAIILFLQFRELREDKNLFSNDFFNDDDDVLDQVYKEYVKNGKKK